jgi:hypothetical protein
MYSAIVETVRLSLALLDVVPASALRVDAAR